MSDTTTRRTATDPRLHMRMTTEFFTIPGKLAHILDPVERMATLGLLGASIGMSIEQGADGHITPEAVLEATGLPAEYAKTLIADGAWHQADHGCARCPQPRIGQVYVHDILEHNHTAEHRRRTSDARRRSGAGGAETRWAGHTKAARQPSGRPPGRPRKNPLPEGQLPLVDVQADTWEPVTPRRGRPRRTEPPAFEPIVHQLCEELAEIVSNNGFSVGKLGPAWWKPCEQLLRIGPPNAKEPVTAEQIRKAMQWANNDAFWWSNVRSMQQLREKYEQLRAAAGDPNRPKRGKAQVLQNSRRSSAAPAAVTVPGMNALYADDYAQGAP